MHRIFRRTASGAWLLAVALACGTEPDTSRAGDEVHGRTQTPADALPAQTAAGPASTASTEADTARLIRPDGIGRVRAGMTIGTLRGVLPRGESLGPPVPYMVDIDAMPIVQDGDTLYSILIVSGESSADNALIELVATTDTTFRTRDGIGPGSTLREAAAVYGAATLAYNTNDESREYASFENAPPGIRFRVAPAQDTSWLAGVYDTGGEYVETTEYDPDARIFMVVTNLR
jgi:hypothetical protein